MDTTTTLPNLQHDHQTSTNGSITTTTTNGSITTTTTNGSITTTTTTTNTITTLNNPLKLINTTKANPFLSKLKCVKKKRTAGKKDKQSKIHTAQGLRDRRMRLSVHTARKFFDLNDMLGFDKASKTIEWLFTKSHKAIQEVTENLQSDAAAADQTVNRISKDIAASFSAGDEDPSVDFHQSQLKSLKTSDDHNMKESSCYPMELADTYYFLKHLHLDNNNNNNNYYYNKSVRNTNAYVGNIITTNQPTNHSIFDYNKSVGEPSDCWLNSRNSLLGFVGGWNTGNPTMELNNRIAPSNGDTNRLR